MSSDDFDVIPDLLLRRAALDRVVKNLLINMAKYGNDTVSHRAPRVTAECGQHGFDVIFRDWGIGVDLAERDRIFEESYRGARVRRHVAGDGLGLYIARTLAEEDLGGRLILSNPAHPTDFRLCLPATAVAPEGP